MHVSCLDCRAFPAGGCSHQLDIAGRTRNWSQIHTGRALNSRTAEGGFAQALAWWRTLETGPLALIIAGNLAKRKNLVKMSWVQQVLVGCALVVHLARHWRIRVPSRQYFRVLSERAQASRETLHESMGAISGRTPGVGYVDRQHTRLLVPVMLASLRNFMNRENGSLSAHN
jgi:hypothetical protein